MYGFPVLLLALLFQSNISSGQKLIRMIVPPYPVKGDNIHLECQPELPQGSKQLKTIKWYKGNNEFFRYGSNHNRFPTPVTKAKVSGVDVDPSGSIFNEVMLKNISFATSGDYMCEVTLTDKTIQIAFGQVRVIAPPPDPPEITGVPSLVRTGDRIVGNCTSYHSKPAASLKLYLNDVPVEIHHLTRHPPTESVTGDTETTVLGFHFLVEAKNFVNNQLTLKCESYVYTNLTGTTIKAIKDGTGIANPPELLMPVYSANPVSIGDQIRGRCSFHYIEEPTTLSFFINGEQAFTEITANQATNLKTGVKMTFLNFDFDVVPTHFMQTKQIHISCNATLREQHFSKYVILSETPYVYQILKLMYGIKNSIVTLHNFRR